MKQSVTMEMVRETKNTVRYAVCSSEADSAAVSDVYIRKFALNGKRPAKIALTVEFED